MFDIYSDILNIVISAQHSINLLISDYFDQLEEGNNLMYLYILGISFLYGLIHALGPGHGKMVIASYFLAHGSKTKEAVKAGFLTALIHAITALFITLSLYLFFQNTISQYFQIINANMYKVSAIFIIGISLYLLFETIKDRNKKEKLRPLGNKNILSIALSIGLVPCPGVMTIVLYSMIVGHPYLGIISAIVMSMGMGITISGAAVFSSHINRVNNFQYSIVIKSLTYLGIFFLFSLGVFLLL